MFQSHRENYAASFLLLLLLRERALQMGHDISIKFFWENLSLILITCIPPPITFLVDFLAVRHITRMLQTLPHKSAKAKNHSYKILHYLYQNLQVYLMQDEKQREKLPQVKKKFYFKSELVCCKIFCCLTYCH